jgi:hypothetical protein
MKRIIEFLDSMFRSPDGDVSIKRMLGMLGFWILAISLFISVLSHRVLTPSIELISAVEYITISCIFGTVIEKFKKGDDSKGA